MLAVQAWQAASVGSWTVVQDDSLLLVDSVNKLLRSEQASTCAKADCYVLTSITVC